MTKQNSLKQQEMAESDWQNYLTVEQEVAKRTMEKVRAKIKKKVKYEKTKI